MPNLVQFKSINGRGVQTILKHKKQKTKNILVTVNQWEGRAKLLKHTKILKIKFNLKASTRLELTLTT